tara:strand:+ start:820 stop:966 length:147 start_codon:yes stop_codon:yes gene_type:complete
MNDSNSNDWDTNDAKNSFGKIIPTNKLFEKSGTGNNKKPPIKPTIIET